ncbi:MAG: hypothetical protein IPK53_10925 [bacterium]|nr:hypothetical protein [bacterium]
MKRFSDRHVADDAAPTTKEVVFVNRHESGVNGTVSNQGIDNFLLSGGITGKVDALAGAIEQVPDTG